MIETIIAAIVSFIGTNIDDMFINMFYFAQADTKKKVRAVVAGKYAGTGFLVLVSFMGAGFLSMVPQKYISLLGVVPIILGIREWNAFQKEQENPETVSVSKSLLVSAALVTVANGADNLGTYIPLFAGYTVPRMMIVLAVFAVMTALWCLLGKKLTDFLGVRGFLLKYKHIIVPAVLVGLGVYILANKSY